MLITTYRAHLRAQPVLGPAEFFGAHRGNFATTQSVGGVYFSAPSRQ